jgi:7-cyano-7-deazaguanine synthase
MKVVIQMSGGVESTTLIAKAIKELGKENVFPIIFLDGSPTQNKEQMVIKALLSYYQLQQQAYRCTTPNWDDFEYKHGTYKVDSDFAFTPGWKLIINMISMAYAQKIGADEVWQGNEISNVYPDEQENNIQESVKLYNKIYESNVKIVGHFKDMTKADVIKYAASIGVPLEITLSCANESYVGGYNCGICSHCLQRKEAFKLSGVTDKTFYMFDNMRK